MTAIAVFVLALSLWVPAALAEDDMVEFVQPAVRNVTPPGVTPGPAVDGPLVRVPTPPRPPEPPRWRRFHLPETTDAATFHAGDKTIRVSGVAAPPATEVCRESDGDPWPCGRTALHSLRMFLRGRAVECYFPSVADAADITAPCRVGQTDLGGWLLAQGWAKPDDLATEDYRRFADEARCAGRGIWQGTEPRRDCPKPSSSSQTEP